MAFCRLAGIPRAFPDADRFSDNAFAHSGCRAVNPYFLRYSFASRPCDFRCFGDTILNSWPHSRQTTLFFWMDFLGSTSGAVASASRSSILIPIFHRANSFKAESARKADRLLAPPAATAASIFLINSLGRVTVAFSVPPRKAATSTST